MRIFISYSSKTRPLVESLSNDLESLGHEAWFDKELSGGQSWWGEILRSIREADLFIFALTPESLDSYPCRLEYTYASELRKHVLPVLLENVDTNLLPPILSVLQFVDYRNRDADSVIKLSRAFTALPLAQPLPDPLPAEPETPLSPLGKLNERINSLTLDLAEQKALVLELIKLLKNSDTFDEAKMLLKRLHERHDLSEAVAEDIEKVLEKAPGQSVIFGLPLRTLGAVVALLALLAVGGIVLVTARNTAQTSTPASTLIPSRIPVTAIAANASVMSTPLHTLYGSDVIPVFNAAFSNDSKYLYAGSKDQTAAVWDTETGKQLYKFEQLSTVNAIFTADNKYLLIGTDASQPRLIDMGTGKEIRRYSEGGDRDAYVSLLPGDKQFITSSYDNSLRLWDVETEQMVRRFIDVDSPLTTFRVSWDGKYLAAANQDLMARVWDINTGELLHTLTGHTGWVTSIHFSPDSRYVLTGSAYEQDNTVRVWEIGKDDSPVHQFKGAYVGIAEDGKVNILSLVSNTATIYESTTGSELFAVPAVSSWLSNDGVYLFTIRPDNTAYLYDAAIGKKLREYQGNITWGMLSQDGRWALTVAGNAIHLWPAGVAQ